MAKSGVILLPDDCELLNDVPPDADIIVVNENETDDATKVENRLDPLATFPRRLRMAMAIRGMSQLDLAKATGITAPGISHYSRGVSEPTSQQLTRLARGLHVSADFLLGLSDKMEVRRK